jgi:hypothetical protein
MWVNFFYIRGGYLKSPPIISDDRYYYEKNYINYTNHTVFYDCYSLVLNKMDYFEHSDVMDFICNLKNIPMINSIDTHFSKLRKDYTFLYGVYDNFTDVTDVVYKNCINKNWIYITSDDVERSKIFGDPCFGTKKFITVKYKNEKIVCYDYTTLYIDINENQIFRVDKVPEHIVHLHQENFIKNTLKKLHNSLYLKYGSFNDEYPEQTMSVKYLKGNEKVLEIGSNIGRNSLIIGYILNQKQNSKHLKANQIVKILSQMQRILNEEEK